MSIGVYTCSHANLIMLFSCSFQLVNVSDFILISFSHTLLPQSCFLLIYFLPLRYIFSRQLSFLFHSRFWFPFLHFPLSSNRFSAVSVPPLRVNRAVLLYFFVFPFISFSFPITWGTSVYFSSTGKSIVQHDRHK
jgi:hypothetical protein